MFSKLSSYRLKLSKKWLYAILISSIALSIILLFSVAQSTTKKFRANFNTQARLIANAIDLERLKKLNGNASDLSSPDYQRIKAQLRKIRKSTKEMKFLYLMGQKKNGVVFFFSDSQKPTSKDYAPPGLVYSEVSQEYLRAFKTRQEGVTSEIEDRWGKLVTALVPIINKETNELVAVLGADIESFNFYTMILSSSLFPTGLTLLIIIFVYVTIYLSNKTKKMREMLGIDPLTELSNRRKIFELAQSEIGLINHQGGVLSTIAIDIDNFKEINDKYGHQYGDTVLQQVSHCLKNTVRKTDHVGRIGGEEFMIVLPNTNKDSAIDVAEKLRQAIAALTFDNKKATGVTVSASFGVSENWDENTDFNELLAHADTALYVSKQEGRNQVTAYEG